MWNFNSVVFLNQDNLIQLFSDEKKLTSPYQLEWNQRVKSLKIFIEDMKQLFDQKEIINNQLSQIFKNLVDLNIYVLRMDNISYTSFKTFVYLLRNRNTNILAVKYSNKKALLCFNYLLSFFENEIFWKRNCSNVQFIMNYSDPLPDDCDVSVKQFLQDNYPQNNEFQQFLNHHESVTSLHAKTFGKLEYKEAQLFFNRISSFHNLVKLTLRIENPYVYFLDHLIIIECLLSLKKLEILEVSGNLGLYYFSLQMNTVSNIKLKTSNIHTLIMKGGAISTNSLKFLSSLKKLCTLRLNSEYEQDFVDLNQTLLQLTQLNEIKLRLRIKQNDADALINSINNLVNLKSLVLILCCETSKKQKIELQPLVFKNFIYLEELCITISNHHFEQINWRQITGSMRYFNKLTELNLSVFNQVVTEEELIEISQSFKFNRNLCKIRLEFSKKNQFGDESLFQLADNIKSLTKLKYIYLVLLSDQISRTATLMLQQSIRQLPTKPFVHLDISDHETALLQFLKLTDPVFPRLQKKNIFYQLCSNKYKVKHYYTFPFLQYNVKSEKLEEEKKQSNLQLITSSETNLGVIGIQGIFNGLSHTRNLTQLYLKFRYNQTGIIGINLIGEKISQLTQLKELSLHLEEIKIEKEGADFIYLSLCKLIQLEYLSLFLNQYYEMSEENNFLDCMPSLSKLRLRNQKNVEVLFETISRAKQLKFLMLVQNHSFNDYSGYLKQLMQLQTLKYLSLYIDLNLGNNEKDELTLFSTVMRQLENLSNLHFTFNTYSYPKGQKKIITKKVIKYKRLVNYSMKGQEYQY